MSDRRSLSTADTLPAPAAEAGKDSREPDVETHSKDFGFLPIPRYLQYDPQRPVHFGLLMNATFGIASTFIVANLYYCQPLLIQFSLSFGVTYDEVSKIPTLVQAGYAVGLLLITPLGDLVRRRPLLLLLCFLTGSLTIGLAITTNLAAFEALTFLIGAFSVVPQILMPLAADLAPPERRASALSIVLAGLLLGVLIARILAGVVAQFVTWRVVYYIAIGVQFAILAILYFVLPDYPAKNRGATYAGILRTMARFAVTEPLLVQAIFITMGSSAFFTNFWVTLTFLLGGPPYHYSTVGIGLFGLVGIVGVCMAPVIGRTIDNLVPWSATLIASTILLLVAAVDTAAEGLHVAAVVIVCVGLDLFRQMQQVSLTTAVLGIDASARSRLNAVILLALFIGQVMGTAAGSAVFNKYGWRPAAALNLGWLGWCLFVLLLRGPHVPRYTWFGYKGGMELRKSRLNAREEKEKANDKPEPEPEVVRAPREKGALEDSRDDEADRGTGAADVGEGDASQEKQGRDPTKMV